jgi:hypothetical protein
MTVDKKAFGALALACVLAAGAGAYLAVRHDGQVSRGGQAAVTEVAASQPGSVMAPQTTPSLPPGLAAPAVPSGGAVSNESGKASARPTTAGSITARPATGESRASRPKPPAARPMGEASAPTAVEAATAVGSGRPSGPPSDPQPAPVETAPVVIPVAQAQSPEPVTPEREFEDLVVPAESVVGLQIETFLTSETARVEDPVRARVTRDVRVGGQVAIPAGSRVDGSVTLVERGGKFKEVARLGVRFHTLILEDGTRLPMNTESVFREGVPPAGESAAKVGGAAVGGAILGAIFGGTRGAVVGGSTGAAGGAAVVAAGDRNPATLPAGATLTVRLTAPVTITVER